LFFNKYGPDTSAFRAVVCSRIRVLLGIAVCRFAMRYMNLIAPWTPGIRRSRVTGHLLFGLEWRRRFRYTVLWPGNFAGIARTLETTTSAVIT
jgi:hypothetical protein